MPKNINYSLGKIYKIYNVEDPTICFVGSTCQPYLCNRMQQHKITYKNNVESKELYKTVLAKGGWDKFAIILIESYPCANSDELNARANHFINTLNARKC